MCGILLTDSRCTENFIGCWTNLITFFHCIKHPLYFYPYNNSKGEKPVEALGISQTTNNRASDTTIYFNSACHYIQT